MPKTGAYRFNATLGGVEHRQGNCHFLKDKIPAQTGYTSTTEPDL
jgi:hypothetical protein